MDIKNYYNYMLENIPQFQEFRKQNKELTTDELMNKFNINVNKEQD